MVSHVHLKIKNKNPLRGNNFHVIAPLDNLLEVRGGKVEREDINEHPGSQKRKIEEQF